MDVKFPEAPPPQGSSLFQTALIYAEANQVGSTGKVTLSSSDGECVVNSQGGVGVMGQFGDITKTKLEPDRWTRVVISVQCVSGAKGHLKTWVNSIPAATVESEAVNDSSRFVVDPENLYLFSSKSNAMVGGVHIRTLRVQAKPSTNDEVIADRALDKIMPMYLSLIHI
eukprot:TRINITY_DN4831_c0_g1_i4.p1 TRINITY_DN4831_c0_g1~~TRINITY_DN4831_c0_g1_i4.p1  ORF type:complete len:169 (-),score=52.52 TRINITY_DN4831_c0_g1_i4:171-677(-)